MEILEKISCCIIEGDDETIRSLTTQCLSEGLEPSEILNKGLIAGMAVIGERFRQHEIFLPDVLLAAKAMAASMQILRPLLEGTPHGRRGKVVLGTVMGDLHDIGKNLVAIMLKGKGFEVVDLGKDVTAQKFVDAAQKENAQVIGMSALLTTTMLSMKSVIECLKERGLSGQVKTIVGGAPVTPQFAKEIGADAYAPTAVHAADEVLTLLGASA